MAYTYRIWDKISPINGCDAETAMKSLKISEEDEVYIIQRDGRDNILQTGKNAPYPKGTIDEMAQAHIAAMEAADAEAESQKVKLEDVDDRLTELQLAMVELYEGGVV